MTLVLQQDDNEHRSLSKSKIMNDIRINEDMIISGPVRCQQTLHVRYNSQLNMFEGLPKVWRDLLELP